MVNQPTAPVAQQRMIRVFVSSTFKDMHAEREELVKRVFPQLRKICEERGVTWGEVDLRWGITEEQAAEGEVLPICLEEIHRCRPYFIALLGQRYGWVPDEIPQELIEMQPWLTEHLESSVTELEILHGVLNNPDMANHAYFYLRDPAYVTTLPPGEQTAYDEGPTPYEIEKLGPEEAERRAEERRNKLEALKERIKNSDFPVHEDYQDPVRLGELVLRDLTALVDRLYPRGSEPDPLDREAAEHEAFAASRAGVYIGRQEYFDRLDNYAQGGDPPIVVLGESGSGKSALLANWALRYRAAHPHDFLLMHFVGGTPESADWAAMLRRIMGELQRRFDIEGRIPDQPDALRTAFAEWLNMAAARGRVVLVLDALNQLEDREGARDLVWLPAQMPANARVILSTLPGRPLKELKQRVCPTLQIEPLEANERRMLVKKYLAQFSKTLSAERIERIASAPQTANPLYLRALLEELRVFGIHEELDQRIDHYLSATTVDDLYEKILERYQHDYERDRPGLVRDTMSLLWAARWGLTQAELLELLGNDTEPLPGAYWSPLYLAAQQSLVNRSGLIAFFHDYLRQAVQHRYLATEEGQRAAHLLLADYFEDRPLSPRKIEELPWQLSQARSWRRLCDLLANPYFLEAAWLANEVQVMAYWVEIEANSSLRLVDAYRPVLDSPASNTDYAVCNYAVAMLLLRTGYTAEARSLGEYLVEHLDRDSHELPLIQWSLAQALLVQGDLDGAMALIKNTEQLLREEWGDLGKDLQITLSNQAAILLVRGDLDGAMALFKEEEQLSRQSGDDGRLGGSLGGQARILRERGDLDGAIALYKEQERLYRGLGSKVGLASSLGDQGMILRIRGDLDGAMVPLKEYEGICRELGDRQGLARTLGNQGVILLDGGDLAGAMALLKEQERICRDLGDKEGLSHSLNNQALILRERGDLDGAMELHDQQERLCRELGDRRGLARTLGNQALILSDRGDLDGAMALHKEEERICRELDDKAKLANCLRSQAVILHTRGDVEPAMVLYKEEEQLRRALGDKREVHSSLGNQALILESRGDLEGAIALYKEREQICRELGDKEGLAACLGRLGVALYNVGHLDRAMAAYDEGGQICRELGDRQGVARSLGNQALIFKTRGDLDGAMALYEEQEQLLRELDDRRGLARSLRSRALTLDDLGDGEKALLLFKQEEQLRRELGDGEGLASSLGSQGVVLKQQGDLDGALALYGEQERISREQGYKGELARSLSNQGQILKQRGDLDAAAGLWGEEERLRRELGHEQKLALCLHRRALALHELGVGEKALLLFKEEEQLRRELGDRKGLADSLGSQGVVLGQKGDLDRALALLCEQEQICRELGGKRRLAGSLANQAAILKQRGDLDRVMVLLQEESEIRRGLGDKQKLVPSLDNQAAILRDRKDHAGALALYDELEQVLRELGDKRVLHLCLGNQAHILALGKDRIAALDLYREKEQICRELGDAEGIARSLCNEALLLAKLGKLGEALPLAEEAHGLVENHELTALAAQAERILDSVRQKLAE